jgi:AcrR family transcriptional regulator
MSAAARRGGTVSRSAGAGAERHDPARERLLATATDLFTRRGYAATSVREIVEQACVTKPVLYYHFGSKERIYLEILGTLERGLDEALERLNQGGGSVRERIERLCLGLFELFEENTQGVRLINAAFWGPPQGAPAFDFEGLHARLRDALGALVEEGVASGELKAAFPEDVALAVLALLTFSMDLHLVHPDWGYGKAGLARLLDLVFAGAVRAPKARKRNDR